MVRILKNLCVVCAMTALFVGLTSNVQAEVYTVGPGVFVLDEAGALPPAGRARACRCTPR